MVGEDERAAKNPLGPTGRRLMENVEALRAGRHLSYQQLSDKLAAVGRRIPTLGLSRIEKGTRRVDADDLMALAITLDVTPNRLLLSPDAGDDDVALTESVATSENDAWLWASGEKPLNEPDAAEGLDRGRQIWELRQWRRENRPHDTHLADVDVLDAFEEFREPLERVADAAAEAEAAGVPHSVLMRWLQVRNFRRRVERG